MNYRFSFKTHSLYRIEGATFHSMRAIPIVWVPANDHIIPSFQEWLPMNQIMNYSLVLVIWEDSCNHRDIYRYFIITFCLVVLLLKLVDLRKKLC